ncbi:MAG: hypothetical protein ABIQ72_17865 [Usitatibacter sp.]
MKRLFSLAAAALVATACVAPDAVKTAAESPSEREYPTGSNIPKKASQRNTSAEGIRVHSREDFERMQTLGNGVPSKGSGLSP